MSLVSRSVLAATAGFALVGLAACGGNAPGGTTSPSAQPAAGLANLDPCKIPTPQQLSADGLQSQGAPIHNIAEEPGCTFKGDDLNVTFFKNQTKTVATYQTQGKWDDYTKTTVNGRSAASAHGAGTANTGGCTVLMDAGGGVVNVQIDDPDKSDAQACAEALKYAQQVEPTLPK